MTDEIKDLAMMAAEAAEEKKASDVQILDVRELTIIADYFVICSGNSDTQVQAIVRGIKEDLGEKGYFPKREAGTEESHWVLLDFADVIVHVFHRDKRKFYELERLWADAEEILSKNDN